MFGHKDKINLFKKLADEDKMSHAYLFFGEPQVGKFLFALSLANYLEKKIFGLRESDKQPLEEALIIEPGENGLIGIDEIKKIINFLYQKPVFSTRRIAIIKGAENLTDEAQNAALKIVENPPSQSLIIFTAPNSDSLSSPLVSRLQKVYFSRLTMEEVKRFLADNGADTKKIDLIAEESFGRPGLAFNLWKDKKSEKIRKLAKNFMSQTGKSSVSSRELEEIIESDMDKFFGFLMIETRKNGYKNLSFAKEILKRSALIKMFNVNKKLQLKAINL